MLVLRDRLIQGVRLDHAEDFLARPTPIEIALVEMFRKHLAKGVYRDGNRWRSYPWDPSLRRHVSCGSHLGYDQAVAAVQAYWQARGFRDLGAVREARSHRGRRKNRAPAPCKCGDDC
jgi:hypothetical protein